MIVNRVKISEMKAWDFWAVPRSLPLTDDEVAACENETATPQQVDKMGKLAVFARHQLIAAVPNEPRPS